MKQERQALILDIINNNQIYNQQQLLDTLLSHGIVSTQATLSRDINDLQLNKQNGFYVQKSLNVTNSDHETLISIFNQCVVSINRAQNIIVIKTKPGFASSACVAIDNMHIDGLVGSLAGDDTAFLAMADNNSAELFLSDIEENLKK